jgi:hypothetical protein
MIFINKPIKGMLCAAGGVLSANSRSRTKKATKTLIPAQENEHYKLNLNDLTRKSSCIDLTFRHMHILRFLLAQIFITEILFFKNSD